MRGRYLLIVLLLASSVAASEARADPFGEVPAGHWAYAACTRLSEAGVLAEGEGPGFTGHPGLTRVEFATALLGPLAAIDRSVRSLGPTPAPQAMRAAAAASLNLDPKLAEAETAALSADLERLSAEFAKELRDLGFDLTLARQGLRLVADPGSLPAAGTTLPPATTRLLPPVAGSAAGDLQFPLWRGAVTLGYNESTRAPHILDSLAVASLGGRSGGLLSPRTTGLALTDPTVAQLQTGYEYRLGSALTLRLGYEEIARLGAGASPLDGASLASIGLGYRLTPSTSLKLSYSLADYENYTVDARPVRGRVAETAVSVAF